MSNEVDYDKTNRPNTNTVISKDVSDNYLFITPTWMLGGWSGWMAWMNG